MKLRTVVAVYATFVGIAMLGMWAMFLLTGQVPELQSEPWQIAMHLAAEFATAILLIASGIGLQGRRRWGERAMFFALGMLVYTVIQSSGYYLQLGQPAFVAMFVVLGMPAVFFGLRLGTEEW